MARSRRQNREKLEENLFKEDTHQERLQRVAEMYLQGHPVYSIAHDLDYSVAMVCNYLQELRKRWLEKADEEFAKRKAEEFAKIDRIEQKAWQLLEKSEQDQEVHFQKEEAIREVSQSGSKKGRPSQSVRMVPLKTVTSHERRGRNGDAKFLETIRWCIETRLKMMGLLKPDQKQVNLINIDWGAMVGLPSNDPATANSNGPTQIHAVVQPVPDEIEARLQQEAAQLTTGANFLGFVPGVVSNGQPETPTNDTNTKQRDI